MYRVIQDYVYITSYHTFLLKQTKYQFDVNSCMLFFRLLLLIQYMWELPILVLYFIADFVGNERERKNDMSGMNFNGVFISRSYMSFSPNGKSDGIIQHARVALNKTFWKVPYLPLSGLNFSCLISAFSPVLNSYYNKWLQ